MLGGCFFGSGYGRWNGAGMTWTYNISAVPAARLLMRVALIFDQQLLTLSHVSWQLNEADGKVQICVRADCPPALAQRMHAKLLHLQDVCHATLIAETETPPAES